MEPYGDLPFHPSLMILSFLRLWNTGNGEKKGKMGLVRMVISWYNKEG